jgi:hypothetical protein
VCASSGWIGGCAKESAAMTDNTKFWLAFTIIALLKLGVIAVIGRFIVLMLIDITRKPPINGSKD